MNPGILFRRLLLIYQMPKTGSQTVQATLQRCSLPLPIVRLHFLSSKREQVTVEDYLEVLQRPKLYDFAQKWFERELEPFMGIDEFAKPFPLSRLDWS